MDILPIEIFKTFSLKPCKSLGISYQPLYNSENSYKNFCNDLENIINIKELMFTKKTQKNYNENYYLQTSNFSVEIPYKDYELCVLEGKCFYKSVKYDEEYITETIDQNGEKIDKTVENTRKPQEIKIPIYIGFKGKIPFSGINTNNNEIGGYFRHNNGIKKYMTHMFSSVSAWPKYKAEKNLYHHFSFQSIPCRFSNKKCVMPQYLTIDLAIDFDFESNKNLFVIDSKSSFIPLNVIILISYLTNFSIEKIERIILNDFESDEIKRTVKICCLDAQTILDIHENDDNKTAVDNYIESVIKLKNDKKFNISKTFIINNFLPHIQNRGQIDKGMFLIIKIRQMLVASFQNQTYPDKDNLATKRIMPIGSQLEYIITEDRESYISECKNKIQKKGLNSVINDLKSNFKTSNIVNNTFNIQNKKWSHSIKTDTGNNNENQSIVITNKIVYPRSLKLNKSLEMRNVHPSTNGWLDPSNTTDHGPNVGLIKSINVGVKVTHYTRNVHKDMFEKMEKYIKDETKQYTDIINGTIISIVDISEFYITSINKSYVKTFIKKLKKLKRENYFPTYDFGICIIPMHKKDKITSIFYPLNNNYLQIRITIGIERLVRPLLVVEKGKINCEEHADTILKDNESLNDYYIFMQKYKHSIEFVDVEQNLYSNICVSVKKFNSLRDEDKKKIQYIEFPPLSKVSHLTSYLTDIGRMAGARVTLGDAQQKHTLSGMSRDIFNKFDNSLNLSVPFEYPCITNDTLQLSNIVKRGFGVHLMVAIMSWKAMNLEDSIILSSKCHKSGKLSVITTTKYKSEVQMLGLNSPLPARLVHSHKKLEATGLPLVGTILEKDDAMHKHVDCRFRNTENYNIRSNISFDTSEGLSTNYPVRLERIRKEGTSNIIIKYILSSLRNKEIGDKMTNQAAQKGTIGCILDDSELPHTINGVVPDIIINSVSIVSRKTLNFYNQVKLTTAYSANPFGDNDEKIKLINYPPLTDVSLDEYHKKVLDRYKRYNSDVSGDILEDKASCLEELYNPYTHELIKCEGGKKHFMGIEYYLLLTQMAIEKITARNRGKKTKLLQAPSGKRRQGGIRFGEMEGDGVDCHGASDVMLALLSDSVEDRIESFVCTRCGEFGTYESFPDYSRWKCLKCENLGYSPELQRFNFTYACKVFLQSLNCRGKIIIPKHEKDPIYYPNFIN